MSQYHVDGRRQDPEKYRARDRQYYAQDRDKRLALQRERFKTPESKAARREYITRNAATIKAKRAIYNKAHPPTSVDKARTHNWQTSDRGREWGRAQHKAKWGHDKVHTMKAKLRTRLAQAIKNGSKVGSAVKLLGCSVPDLMEHLQKQFLPGMTWDNWNKRGWHIDHIKPLAAFDLTDHLQLLEACHYTNLQPLWALENMRKGKKVSEAA